MSKKDPNDGLTDEQQAFEEKFVSSCAKNFKNLSTQLKANCVNITRNQQIINQARLDKEELNKRMSGIAQVNDARTFVTEWVNKWQTHASLILAAVIKASEDYNLILNTRASQPIALGLLVDLAILFIPELLPLEKVFKVLAIRKYPKQAVEFADAMLKSNRRELFFMAAKVKARNYAVDKMHSGAKQIDKRADDIIGAIRNNVSSNKSVDAASQQLAAAYNAKNQILKEILGNTMSNLIMVTNLASGYYFLIDIIPPEYIKNAVTGLINYSDFVSTAVPIPDAHQYEMFSDQILYDMLRAYVKGYFVVNTPSTSGFKTIDAMPKEYGESAISGLDEAQREMIYEKFRKVSWSDKNRPPVNSYKDLVKFWNGTFRIVYPTASDIADQYKPY